VFLLGETSGARVPEESAEAVVALTPGESPEEQRAKEPKRQPSLENSAESPESRPKPSGSGHQNRFPLAGSSRTDRWIPVRKTSRGGKDERLANTRRMKELNE
jgi:hypothetical protein